MLARRIIHPNKCIAIAAGELSWPFFTLGAYNVHRNADLMTLNGIFPSSPEECNKVKRIDIRRFVHAVVGVSLSPTT